jgi:hypothetical protein
MLAVEYLQFSGVEKCYIWVSHLPSIGDADDVTAVFKVRLRKNCEKPIVNPLSEDTPIRTVSGPMKANPR